MVLGGPHVTLMPDESQAHADVIFIGDAEIQWPQFLADFETGLDPPLEPGLRLRPSLSSVDSHGVHQIEDSERHCSPPI